MTTEMTDIVGADHMHISPRVTLVRWGGSPRNAQTITNALEKLGTGWFEVEVSRLQGSLFNKSQVPELLLALRSIPGDVIYDIRLEPNEWAMVVHMSGRLIALSKLPRDADLSYYTTASTIVLPGR